MNTTCSAPSSLLRVLALLSKGGHGETAGYARYTSFACDRESVDQGARLGRCQRQVHLELPNTSPRLPQLPPARSRSASSCIKFSTKGEGSRSFLCGAARLVAVRPGRADHSVMARVRATTAAVNALPPGRGCCHGRVVHPCGSARRCRAPDLQALAASCCKRITSRERMYESTGWEYMGARCGSPGWAAHCQSAAGRDA